MGFGLVVDSAGGDSACGGRDLLRWLLQGDVRDRDIILCRVCCHWKVHVNIHISVYTIFSVGVFRFLGWLQGWLVCWLLSWLVGRIECRLECWRIGWGLGWGLGW